ncbi:MAG: hypothetical protein QOJ15_220 [Bradyrhizobium sp.]|nr:hypothetical protein [Bradyrhizobium sp.]
MRTISARDIQFAEAVALKLEKRTKLQNENALGFCVGQIAECLKGLVVCAVRYEPVSLLFGQEQGDFREKQREDYRKYENAPETGHFSFFRINR